MGGGNSAGAAANEPNRNLGWIYPLNWGMSARSAVLSATVVTVALAVAGAGLLFLLYRSLLSGVDDAAAGRVRDTLAALNFDKPTELDGDLLTTDQRIVAVQIVDANGKVSERSNGAPESPLIPLSALGTTLRMGIPDDASPDSDMRISGQTADTGTGRYTVIAAGGSESVESTLSTVALLLAVAAPIVIGVAAAVSYRLVKRSLRSVEAIRTRVAEISTTELAERVPVPSQNDEISALAKTMNEMLARVEAGHFAQRQFVGDASHELRSPIASIISALEIAVDYPELLDDELKSGTLLPEAYRMQSLVEDLLLLARADECGFATREGEVYLDTIAESVAARVRVENNLDVHTDIKATNVIGDASAISRLMRNLLDNAVRHANSCIDIVVEERADNALLVIGDDGPGIPEAERVRVFDRFVRLDTDRSRMGGGTGLGLAIVAEIVAAHSGTIGIGERPGGGTLVTVTLPCAG
jgi:signal transduction histidine kinase